MDEDGDYCPPSEHLADAFVVLSRFDYTPLLISHRFYSDDRQIVTGNGYTIKQRGRKNRGGPETHIHTQKFSLSSSHSTVPHERILINWQSHWTMLEC